MHPTNPLGEERVDYGLKNLTKFFVKLLMYGFLVQDGISIGRGRKMIVCTSKGGEAWGEGFWVGGGGEVEAEKGKGEGRKWETE